MVFADWRRKCSFILQALFDAVGNWSEPHHQSVLLAHKVLTRFTDLNMVNGPLGMATSVVYTCESRSTITGGIGMPASYR